MSLQDARGRLHPSAAIAVQRNRSTEHSDRGSIEDTVKAWSHSYRRASLFMYDRENKPESLDRLDTDVENVEPESPLSPISPVIPFPQGNEREPLLPKEHVPMSTFAQSCFNSVNILM